MVLFKEKLVPDISHNQFEELKMKTDDVFMVTEKSGGEGSGIPIWLCPVAIIVIVTFYFLVK